MSGCTAKQSKKNILNQIQFKIYIRAANLWSKGYVWYLNTPLDEHVPRFARHKRTLTMSDLGLAKRGTCTCTCVWCHPYPLLRKFAAQRTTILFFVGHHIEKHFHLCFLLRRHVFGQQFQQYFPVVVCKAEILGLKLFIGA